MRNCCSLFLLVATIGCAVAQESLMSPLGVLITPRQKIAISKQLRSALPAAANVRLLESTKMSADGEQVVVYETGGEYEPDSHLAVVKSGVRIADFRLIDVFRKDDVGGSYTLFAASQFLSADNQNVFISAYRNIGNGAGTIFLLVAEHDGKYQLVWKSWMTQARFKVLKNGKVRVWNSEIGDACVWCPHQYDINTLEWKDGRLVRVSRYTTIGKLNPDVSDKPIVIEK